MLTYPAPRILILVIAVSLMTSCSEESPSTSDAVDTESSPVASSPTSNVNATDPALSTERIKIPFQDIGVNWNISIPPGTRARFRGEGAVIGDPRSTVFEEPVHPSGEINSLAIDGHSIALTSTKLEDGMLSTKDFGDLEFLMLGPGQTEVHATISQIQAIKEWLESQ